MMRGSLKSGTWDNHKAYLRCISKPKQLQASTLTRLIIMSYQVVLMELLQFMISNKATTQATNFTLSLIAQMRRFIMFFLSKMVNIWYAHLRRIPSWSTSETISSTSSIESKASQGPFKQWLLCYYSGQNRLKHLHQRMWRRLRERNWSDAKQGIAGIGAAWRRWSISHTISLCFLLQKHTGFHIAWQFHQVLRYQLVCHQPQRCQRGGKLRYRLYHPLEIGEWKVIGFLRRWRRLGHGQR